MDDVIAYYNMVIGHERTINDVPTSVRYEVTQLLIGAGYHDLIDSEKTNCAPIEGAFLDSGK